MLAIVHLYVIYFPLYIEGAGISVPQINDTGVEINLLADGNAVLIRDLCRGQIRFGFGLFRDKR